MQLLEPDALIQQTRNAIKCHAITDYINVGSHVFTCSG